MKKSLLSFTLAGMLLFAAGLTARAEAPVVPSVTAVEPAFAYNDIDTRVTITGADFVIDASATPAVAPTITLGTTPLTDVTWVDTQTLTATVPWGMNPDVYGLTVTNPGGEATTLPAAFEVKSGIGNWNAGELNGASVAQLLMKPGDSNTLYALAYDVGLFRSDDAGANWHFTSADVIGNADFVLDPNPGHEDWLYSFMSPGLFVSKNKGDTWTQLPFKEPDPSKSPPSHEVFVSPHNSLVLFVATYGNDTYVPDEGLKKSTNGGKTWTVVPSMVCTAAGTAVQNVAFDPTPGSQNMVLATADARVFTSSDLGNTWTQVASPPGITSVGFRGYLTYNPYKPGEVWLSSTEMAGGVFKSNDVAITGWTRSEPSWYTSGYKLTFVGPDDIYMWLAHSTDGGATWTTFGPSSTWGTGDFVFATDGVTIDTSTVYFTNATVGVQKSTTGGVTGPSGEASWTASNQGLTGMRCVSMSVSTTDPLRVYATFNGWGGVFVSDDGTSHWTYVPITGSGQMWQVLQDPFDPGLVYATGGGFYTSRDHGETWHDLGWTGIPDSEKSLMGFGGMAADPFTEGHLLISARVGQSSAHDQDLGYVFSSDDHGATWTSVVVTGTAGSSSAVIGDIVFDPENAGWAYLATGGNGIWKSVDHGATWARIDDRSTWMTNAYSISIATHPQHVLLVSGDSGRPYRSFDGGKTWELKQGSGEVSARKYVFVDGDSTRLYSPDWTGLHFSNNVGDSWTSAAGALGSIQNTTLAYTKADGHTLLYAATTGGKTGVVIASATSRSAAAGVKSATARSETALAPIAPNALVGAGIYRRAQVPVTKTFTSSGSQDGWILESSHTSNRGGAMSSSASTLRLGDDRTKKQYRSILSFNTSGLPDSAVITNVTLRIRKQGIAGGGNPITTFQGLVCDIKNGYFGSRTSLQASDFQASASKSYGLGRPAPASNWYGIGLTGAKGYVNKTSARSGLTQLRLRFKLDDNNNRTANYLSLASGNGASSSRPQLVITYYVP
jgi:hypothetical protein